LLNITGPAQPGPRIEATSQPRTEPVPLTDQAERLALADRLRPDLNEARLRRDHFNLELVRTRNGLLPKLDLFIDLGKTGYAESFGSSVNNLDDDNYELAAGIRFSTYLGRRESEGRDLVARASREQAAAAIENLRSLVELDVRLALNETERTRRQIEASAVTRQLQAQTLEAEQERFSIGTSTSLLVAQAQRDLLLSALAEIEAVVDYRIALVNLFLAEGSLLERRGVRLPAAD
ncbi:MAG: TolC family protein, partial [Desulfurivibrionaceae bacterium]